MAEKKFSDLTAKGAALADTDLLAISEDAGGGAYTSKSVTGANVKALVTDANLTTTDITTNDVSTSKHGFAPKAPNDTTKFLRGDGTWAVPAAGGLTEFTEAETTAAPNATVPVNSLTPVAGTTNADFAIVPKGTGAIIAAIPDNTTTGGNKRGANAVDLQMTRAVASQVASGNYSFVVGRQSTASGTYGVALGDRGAATAEGAFGVQEGTASGIKSFAFGTRTTASGNRAIAMSSDVYGDCIASGENSFSSGSGNTASATNSVAIGGNTNTASGVNSYARGVRSSTLSITGRDSYGYGIGNNVWGETQKSTFILGIRTTGNTATTLTVGGGAAGTTNQVILSNQSAYRFKGTIIGKQSGSTNVAAWDVDGIIVRGANSAATTLSLGNVTLVQNTPAWGTPTLAADTTNGGLRVQVTGATATNIQWTAVIETTEVIYA
jgi:hypothetical protein